MNYTDEMKKLYKQWRNEFNYGHNKKDHQESLPEDPFTLFGNQDFYINMYQDVFSHYNLPFEGNFLDIGCSMGGTLFSVEKTQNFDFLAGVDIDETAIEMGKVYKNMHQLKHVDLQTVKSFSYNYKDNTFDVIFLKDVIEHIFNVQNMEKLFTEVSRVLKPGGYVFIEAPNYFYPHESHLDIPKLPYYTSKSMLRLLAKLRGKNVEFVEQLNFVNPYNTKKILKKQFTTVIDIYYDYRIARKLAQKNASVGKPHIDKILHIMQKIGIHQILASLLKYSRLYPSLWFIAIK